MDRKKCKGNNMGDLAKSVSSEKNIVAYFVWFLMQVIYLSIFFHLCKNKQYELIFAFMVILIGVFVIGNKFKEKRFKNIILQQAEEIRELKERITG